MNDKEENLDIAAHGLQQRKGFSMDIGGSLSKAVYTTDEGDTIRLHFMCRPRPETKEIIKKLKKKIGGRQPDGTMMNTCGVGFQEYGKLLTEELNVTVQVNEELNCFIEGFRYLVEHVPLEKLVYLDSIEFQETMCQVASLMARAINILSGKGKHLTLASEEPDRTIRYPLLLCMLGSGGAGVRLDADGSFQICEQYTRCGRTILGLANLIVGAKTFPELIDLASRGDASELHVQAKHLLTGVQDVYSQVPGDFMVYTFGQAANKDRKKFKREDMAAALLGMLCEDLAQTCHLTAQAQGVKQIFFCGSVTGASPYIRQQMKMILAVKDILNAKSTRYQTYFLKYGGYFGAIGALLRTLKPTDNK